MKKKMLLLALLLVFGLSKGRGQSAFVPLNSDYYHLVERYEIKRGKFSEQFHASVKPYNRKGVAALCDSALRQLPALSKSDHFNLMYLLNDNWEWADSLDNHSKKPWFKTFYENKANFFHVDTKDFHLQVNPVLYFMAGRENQGSNPLYLNTRGVELRGIISKKIGFYTFLADNQAQFPYHLRQYIRESGGQAGVSRGALPGEGFWKTQEATGNNLDKGVDFLTARGYINFDVVRNVSLQFGHDKHAFGNGYRSLFLSDFSGNYLFLKANVRVWKINYSVMTAQMTADILAANNVFPKKYAAFHHLSINLSNNFNLGLFESVVYARKDNSKNDTFEFAYLNPIIFYRSLEQGLGSADNSLLGMDFRWNLWKRLQVYGQLLLDEFVISEVRSGKGWWGNKQAGQLGAKYIDVAGIRNLDVQVETNIVRPYTYSHFINPELSNYANYKQAIAHPLGANFREFIGIARYQPLPRLNLCGKAIYAIQGRDEDGPNAKNWGANILRDNSQRPLEYGNKIGQGVRTELLFLDFTASWQLRQNLFIDLKQIVRNFNSANDVKDVKLTCTMLSLRYNIGQRLQEF